MAVDVSERDTEALLKARVWEENASEEQMKLGWQWHEVGIAGGTINKLITMGLVERTYQSRSFKHHKLTEKAKIIMDAEDGAVQEVRDMDEEPTEEIYAHMFDDIVGYDDLKELIREGLQLEKPIHVLLAGPPAIAKTMFLFDIEKIYGKQAKWFLGSGTSRVGLWDAVAEERPRILLIDELDKMKSADYAALLSLMEKGRVTITKHNKKIDVMLDVWVIACANRASSLSAELISRFSRKDIKEYNALEFRQVVTKTLVMHEAMGESDASRIALKLIGRTHNVRDAIRVARMSKRVGIDRAVELILD